MAGKSKVEEGSGNVFADAGLPDAEVHLVKAQLVSRLYDIIRRRKLTQAQAAKVLGIKQPHVSQALEAEPDIRIQVRAHPASGGSANGTSLDVALSQCDVVLGRGSSALLEALWFRKAVIVFRSETRDDPLGLVVSGLAMGCSSPATLSGLCRSVVADADAVSMTRATARAASSGPRPPKPGYSPPRPEGSHPKKSGAALACDRRTRTAPHKTNPPSRYSPTALPLQYHRRCGA